MSRRECLADRIMWRADATMHVEADCGLKRRDSRLILIHFIHLVFIRPVTPKARHSTKGSSITTSLGRPPRWSKADVRKSLMLLSLANQVNFETDEEAGFYNEVG